MFVEKYDILWKTEHSKWNEKMNERGCSMKRWKLVVVLLVIITLSSPFLFDYILKAKQNHFIRDTFGFNKKEFKVLKETDSHRGFHGDGDYVLILDCSENKEKALE